MSLVEPLDVGDDRATAAWHAAYLAAERHGRPHAVPYALEELRADFSGARVGERFLPCWRRVDGEVVACGLAVLPQKENLHLAHVEVWTHPDHRRAGHGTAVLEHLLGVAREAGRTTLLAATAVPYDGPADGAGSPGTAFLTRHGFEFDLGDVMRVLDLPCDTGRLEELAAEAAPYHRDYTLRRFVGPVPEDILLPFGELIGSLVTEAPSGEIAWDREVFDEERIRADEAVFAAAGRTKYTTVAADPTGALVAYSELVVSRYDPDHVFQWGTLVAPDHRGHRLGLATKAHTLLFLHEAGAARGTLVTFNAEVNRHMIAVNEALGFRPVERVAEFRATL